MKFSKARVDIIRNFLRYCKKSEEKIPPPSHVKYYNDFRIIVENPKGTQRFWTDPSTGEKGATTMLFDYGFFHGSKGLDKDEVDCYLGPEEKAPFAYVIRQLKPKTGKFDETKIMLGFTREQDARAAYEFHYNRPGFYGGMTVWPIEKLRQALKDSIYDPSIIKSGYIHDLRTITEENTYFRKVVYTDKINQLVIMNIEKEIGIETHKYVEQTFFLVEGNAKVVYNKSEKSFKAGEVLVIPPNTQHNIINIGTIPLKLFTIYTPPNHINGRIHRTKEEADADLEDRKFGEKVE